MAAGLGAGGFALVFLILGLLLGANRTVALGLSSLVGAAVFGFALYSSLDFEFQEEVLSVVETFSVGDVQ